MSQSDITCHKPSKGFKLVFPTILTKCRSEHGKQIRKLYKNDIGVPYQEAKGYVPRTDGMAMTVTTFTTDNNIIYLNNTDMKREYKPNPTKEYLTEYFAPRIAVRKMVPKEAGRLMGLNDHEIELIQSYPFKTYKEKADWERQATKKERNKIKKQLITKTNQFKLFGNSIVVDCIFHLFRTMFIANQPENEQTKHDTVQLTLF